MTTVNFAIRTDLTPEEVEGNCLVYMIAGPGDALALMRQIAADQLQFAQAELRRDDRLEARVAVENATAIHDAFNHATSQGPFPLLMKETLQ